MADFAAPNFINILPTDKIPIYRAGEIDPFGNVDYLTLQAETIAQSQPTDLILVNQPDDLAPFFGDPTPGKYTIPEGKGIKFLRNFAPGELQDAPIVLPQSSPAVILGSYGPTGQVQVPINSIESNGNWVGLQLRDLTLIPTGATPLFNLINGSNPANWALLMQISNVATAGWASLGIIDGFNLSSVDSWSKVQCGDGIIFQNFASLGITIDSWAQGQNQANAVYYTISGIANRLHINGPCAWDTQSNESVLYIDPSVTTNQISVANPSFTGNGQFFASGSLNQDDPELLVKGAIKVPDTKTEAIINAIPDSTTVISASDTFTNIAYTGTGLTSSLIKRLELVASTPGSSVKDTIIHNSLQSENLALRVLAQASANASPIGAISFKLKDGYCDNCYIPAELEDNNIIAAQGIIPIARRILATYEQAGTTVTISLDNAEDGNQVYQNTNIFYAKILDGAAESGVYTITSSSTTSLTYTANNTVTTSGSVYVYDIIQLGVKNITNTNNITTSYINLLVK